LLSTPAERQRLSEKNRQAVLSTHNWENVARAFERIFKEARATSRRIVRLGSIYRLEMLRLLGLDTSPGCALDMGCYDGYALSHIDAPQRFGLDLSPQAEWSGKNFLCADATQLPFAPDSITAIYALDIMEHFADDVGLIQEISRILAPDGRLILTTPSVDIRLNPPFLTQWISRQWGHIHRPGYRPEQLLRCCERAGMVAKVIPWNAPGYRFWYLGLRTLHIIVPSLSAQLTRKIARQDFKKRSGQRGFYIVQGSKDKPQRLEGKLI
jgi:SAM-dependent methyltransferase